MDTTKEVDLSAKAYNCPNCGAELYFDADKHKLACEFCLSEFTIEEIGNTNAEELADTQKSNAADFCEHMNEYSCPNCGAEIAAEEHTAADICVYCHSPIVLKGKLSGQMKPDKIVPFKFGKEEAEKKFFEFASKKWFVPKDFKSRTHADKIQGVYYPFWVTDADTVSTLYADATKVRTWRIGNTEYIETSRFACERAGDIHFEDIVSSAYSQAEKDMLEGILPYPSEALQDFSMPFLSGFQTKKRDIERSELSSEVKQRMDEYAKTLLRNTVRGYASVNVRSTSLNIKQSHWEYSLMPIWMLNYVTPKKTYVYAVNGHTGKIYGELPISFKKLRAAAVGVAAAVAPIAAAIGGIFL
ncbi:MAG: TFIIB-type zinc ribbon-containing protein [Clostridia bacterium]|nr:TFIIB-type zinc ribbon-containing protein [Clostridia bacterium]